MMNDQKYLDTPIEIEDELKDFFCINKPKYIFDIGACDGLDSIKYSKLFPFSKVYSFEPLENNATLLLENLLKYNVQNVFLHRLALSNTKGEAEFYVSTGRPENISQDIEWDFGNKSSSLLEPNKTMDIHPWLKFQEKILVPTETLNNFLIENKIELVDFVHMDVQGAELMVLQGAQKYLNKIKMIWLEVENVELYKNQPLAMDVETYLKSNGFTKIKDTVNHIAGDQLWVNYSFFPYKKIKRNLYNVLRTIKLLK